MEEGAGNYRHLRENLKSKCGVKRKVRFARTLHCPFFCRNCRDILGENGLNVSLSLKDDEGADGLSLSSSKGTSTYDVRKI